MVKQEISSKDLRWSAQVLVVLNGSSMRHAKNMPCTNHHGTYVRSMAVDMYEKQLLSGRETIQTDV